MIRAMTSFLVPLLALGATLPLLRGSATLIGPGRLGGITGGCDKCEMVYDIPEPYSGYVCDDCFTELETGVAFKCEKQKKLNKITYTGPGCQCVTASATCPGYRSTYTAGCETLLEQTYETCDRLDPWPAIMVQIENICYDDNHDGYCDRNCNGGPSCDPHSGPPSHHGG